MKKFLAVALALLSIANISPVSAEATTQIYVAPNSIGDGSAKKPFGNLDEALYAISAARGSDTAKEYEIELMGGRYDLSDGLGLDATASNITIKAQGGANVSFSGGSSIDGKNFKAVTDPVMLKRFGKNASNIVVADYDASKIKTKDPSSLILTYNDTALTDARWPNQGFSTIETVIKSDPSSESIFSIDNVRVKNWAGEENPYIFGYFLYTWYSERKHIGAIDPVSMSITIADQTQWGINEGKQFYVYNMASELDTPGEFYIDNDNNKLYFYPLEDKSSSSYLSGSVSIAQSEQTMLNLSNIDGLTLEGITFEDSLSIAILMDSGCKNVTVKNCTFKNINKGIKEMGFDNLITDCDFYNIASYPVKLAGGDRATLTSGNTKIDNCKFHDFDVTDRTNVGAVRLEGCGETISHCEFVGGPHTVISLSGNDNVIECNEFYDNMVDKAADASPIYGGRDLSSQNNVIRNNYFHDIYPTMGCIYFDDALSNDSVYNNVAVNTSRLVFIHGGILNKVDNNLVINSANTGASVVVCGDSSYYWSTTKQPITEADNIFLYHLMVEQPWQSEPWQKYSESYKYIDNVPDSDVPPYECEFIGNTIVNCKQKEGTVQGIGAVGDSVLPYITIKNNEAFDDDNYIIPDNYQDIMDSAGLYTDEVRTTKDSLGKFNLIIPNNKATGVDAMEVEFEWTPCANATRYLFTLSTDKEFKNIISNKKVSDTHVTIQNLNYHRQRYFWKVKAIGKETNFESGATTVSSAQEYFSFTTDVKPELNRVKFDDYLASCEQSIAGMVEGDEPGAYKPGTVQKAKDILEKYTKAGQRAELTQNALDKLYLELKSDFKLVSTRKNQDEYDFYSAFSSPGWWNIVPNQTTYGKGEMRYNTITSRYFGSLSKVEPHYTYSFDANISDFSTWIGFGLRAQASPTMVAWAGNSQYLFIIKEDTFEFQKWNGSQTLLEYTNNIVKAGEWHSYNFVCDTLDDGTVDVIISIDGQEVVHLNDTEDPITGAGYFEVYGPDIGSSISFRANALDKE